MCNQTHLTKALKRGLTSSAFVKVKGCYKLPVEEQEAVTADEKPNPSVDEAGTVTDLAVPAEKPSPIIEEWLLDFEQNVIQGIVYGYQDQEDGLEISTSRVRNRRSCRGSPAAAAV